MARHDGGMQLTAFGAQDRSFFDGVPCRAPWPQLMGRPFGTRGSAIVIPFSFEMRRISLAKRSSCPIRRAKAGCAGVIRMLVVLKARGADVVRTLVVLEARGADVGRKPVRLFARCGERDRRGA